TPTSPITPGRVFLTCAGLLPPEQEERLRRVWANRDLDQDEKFGRLLEAFDDGFRVLLLDDLHDLLDADGRLADPGLAGFVREFCRARHRVRLVLTSRVPVALAEDERRHERQVVLRDGLPTADAVALLRDLDPNGEFGLSSAPDDELARL